MGKLHTFVANRGALGMPHLTYLGPSCLCFNFWECCHRHLLPPLSSPPLLLWHPPSAPDLLDATHVNMCESRCMSYVASCSVCISGNLPKGFAFAFGSGAPLASTCDKKSGHWRTNPFCICRCAAKLAGTIFELLNAHPKACTGHTNAYKVLWELNFLSHKFHPPTLHLCCSLPGLSGRDPWGVETKSPWLLSGRVSKCWDSRRAKERNIMKQKHYWQYLAIFGNIWQYLAIFGNSWQYLAIFGNIWQYRIWIGKFDNAALKQHKSDLPHRPMQSTRGYNGCYAVALFVSSFHN